MIMVELIMGHIGSLAFWATAFAFREGESTVATKVLSGWMLMYKYDGCGIRTYYR